MSRSLPATRGRLLLVLLLVFVLAPHAASAAPAALPLIDHFDGVQGPLNAVLGTPAASTVLDSDVLGGERDIQVTVLAGSLPSPAGMRVDVGSSLLSSSQDSGVVGQTLVTYDGPDGDANSLDPTGLNHLDLTQANTNNGFELTSRLNDLPIDLIITVYTNGASASSATLHLPGGQASSAGPITHYIEFAAFTQAAGASSPADFTDVGAVQLLINGFNDASDLTIEDLRVTCFDWGDLPQDTAGHYPTTYSANGPRHVIGNLFLGELIDSHELNGLPTIGADGDDKNGLDDEDGVTPTPGVLWASGAGGGSVDVTVTGGSGCLSAWIDWNGDGVLTGSGENILDNVAVTAGATTHTFMIPVDPRSSSFYARFRLYARDAGGLCTSPRTPTGRAINGEVEDYLWGFGPNAVSLSSFGAVASPVSWPWVGSALASATVLLVGLRRLLRP